MKGLSSAFLHGCRLSGLWWQHDFSERPSGPASSRAFLLCSALSLKAQHDIQGEAFLFTYLLSLSSSGSSLRSERTGTTSVHSQTPVPRAGLSVWTRLPVC